MGQKRHDQRGVKLGEVQVDGLSPKVWVVYWISSRRLSRWAVMVCGLACR
ncbi:MAG: hypothetical protein M3Z25_10960 [Actinomycetota bacterium]|nr:hypothetical protein [Actinomycetota bacterium]